MENWKKKPSKVDKIAIYLMQKKLFWKSRIILKSQENLFWKSKNFKKILLKSIFFWKMKKNILIFLKIFENFKIIHEILEKFDFIFENRVIFWHWREVLKLRILLKTCENLLKNRQSVAPSHSKSSFSASDIIKMTIDIFLFALENSSILQEINNKYIRWQ